MSASSEKTRKAKSRSPAEWVSFGISLAILAGMVGLVIYRWFATETQPPVLNVKTGPEIRQVEGQFYVPFAIANTGGDTVEVVEITAQLVVKGKVEEEGSQTIDFLSGGEVESGAFIFSRDPQQGKLIVRATGYNLP
ncbi:MAG: TIGR02588 family protein [Cyanobacteriota bacterium]|nr:TIGR02588 family protein [Cyanobacteriota bacterium]